MQIIEDARYLGEILKTWHGQIDVCLNYVGRNLFYCVCVDWLNK